MENNVILIGYYDDEDLNRLENKLVSLGHTCKTLSFGDKSDLYQVHWDLKKNPVITYRSVIFNYELFNQCKIVFSKWWRMDTPYLIDYLNENFDYKKFSESEWESTFKSILHYFYNIFKKKWVGDPLNILNSNLKLSFLKEAINIGFQVPDTIISNDIKEIDDKKKWITKAINKNLIISKNEYFYTVSIDNNFIKQYLYQKNLETPCLIQNEINKFFEIRIFYFDSNNISIILQSNNISIDSRLDSGLQIQLYKIKSHLKKSIIKLMNKIGIKYATLDFVCVTMDQLFLVDITPEGSWSYYEQGEQFISNKIAEFISKRLIKDNK